MIITNATQEALMELIKQAFQENRVLDRMVSVLNVNYACNESSAKIHEHMAHYFPLLADKIGEKTLERYNISVVYGETSKADEDYSSVTQIIETLESRMINFQSMLMGVCKIAFENNDLNVYADLLDMLEDFNKFVEQAILLADKIHFYGEEKIMSFDKNIDHFWILGE